MNKDMRRLFIFHTIVDHSCGKISFSVNFALVWGHSALLKIFFIYLWWSRTFDSKKTDNFKGNPWCWFRFTVLIIVCHFKSLAVKITSMQMEKTPHLVKTVMLVPFQLFSNLRTFGNSSWWYILSSSQLFVRHRTSHRVYTLWSRCLLIHLC